MTEDNKRQEQCTIQNVMWRCNQSIRNDEGYRVFTNQAEYKQVGVNGEHIIILIDDKGNKTEVFKCWFTST
tara:strand:+ start:394 stop:606 length:213 start_codon:yes stop_codon:yes gene_type:complete